MTNGGNGKDHRIVHLGPFTITLNTLRRYPAGSIVVLSFLSAGDTAPFEITIGGFRSWSQEDYIRAALHDMIDLAERPDVMFHKLIDEVKEDVERMTGIILQEDALGPISELFSFQAEWARLHLQELKQAQRAL